jgi:hypothetical protein
MGNTYLSTSRHQCAAHGGDSTIVWPNTAIKR